MSSFKKKHFKPYLSNCKISNCSLRNCDCVKKVFVLFFCFNSCSRFLTCYSRHGQFQGWGVNLGGCTMGVPLLDLYKIITPKAFDLEQVIYDHRQVGQAGKNGDAPKEACLNFGQQCLNVFISSSPRKLNYRRLEAGRMLVFFWTKIYFFYLQPSFGILSFLTLKINIKTTCSLLQEKFAWFKKHFFLKV